MVRLAEFSATTKAALAKRAGFRCSFPQCPAITIGPSDESTVQSASSGMACHIYAASDGPAARRVNSGLTIDELRSIDNGIWMCYTHGKIIDTDEATYTPETLKHWRKVAEKKAQLRQQLGADVNIKDTLGREIPLPKINVEISGADNINGAVGSAFFESCLGEMWGEDASNSIREFAIEMARNAFTHGRATKFIIAIEPHKITLRDNGEAFSLSQLTNHIQRRGGGTAAAQIQSRFKDEIILSYIRQTGENVVILALIRTAKDVSDITPCSVQLNFDSRLQHYEDVLRFCESHQECGTIYLVPKYGISHSDAVQIAEKFPNGTRSGQQIVLVCSDVSLGLEEYIKRIAPDLVLMKLRS